MQRVIAEQRRKEALKLHREVSVDASLAADAAAAVSERDAGHTLAALPRQPSGKEELAQIQEQSGELQGSNSSGSGPSNRPEVRPCFASLYRAGG